MERDATWKMSFTLEKYKVIGETKQNKRKQTNKQNPKTNKKKHHKIYVTHTGY